ncbi:hypothetical protein [Pseudidiomarina terrestris]|uniref:Uncharacterized protein n=1 Tax=Pseudidiomarina terrestris TaxID=2820060 RepID=A0AAW7QYD7_9GAMM|nr:MULTISPECIES: hypothetical protein [unclassified Pseudidiomarina]MDN7123752.1 hypothetical protein [Pseudidiomarina sp. 1APP75-32.1]MDN7135228.1 hypothetical protein [Pseudidiomarina sp. 1ASP75-5]MEA3587002.1 hypothetical protein [Pseudidiomarina sp. 1APP75-27a]
MRKLLIVAIFAAAFYQYYVGGFGAHLMPDVDLGQVAGELKRKATEKDPTQLKLECPHGHYVAVDQQLQTASCQERTRL